MSPFLQKYFYLPSRNNVMKSTGFFIFASFILVLPLRLAAESMKPVPPIDETKDLLNRESYSDPYLQAEYLFHSGELLEAKPYYHEYLKDNPNGQRWHNAIFRLGLIDQNNNSYSTALRFYRMLLSSYPNSSLTDDVKFNMGVCNYELGNYDSAEDLFNAIIRSSPDKKRKWKALYYLAELDDLKLSFDEAIKKLKQVYIQADDKELSQQAFKLTEEMIDGRFSERALSSLIQKYKSGFPVDLLMLKKISIFREQGDAVNYETGLKEFLGIFPDHDESTKVRTDLEQIQVDNDARIHIGVILPLTGKLAGTGQRVLQGIQLAFNQLPEEFRKMIFLNVKDSSGSRTIEEKIGELASNPKTVGILGPLLSDEVKRSGQVADFFRIPVFSPTASSAGLVESSQHVFRNALTRKIQAQFLAEYAVNNLKLRRFVILYPMEPFGEELKNEFMESVEAFGGEIVGVASYDRSQNDFKNQILELGGIADDDLTQIAKNQLLNNEKVDDFSDQTVLSRPKVDMEHWSEGDIENLKVSLELGYDAVFIPGVYDKVGLIIPQLAFYNIDEIVLLGANGWNSPELIEMGGKFLKSVYFVDGFFPDSNQERVKKFVEQFQNNYGEIPSHFSAQAYDAAGIFFQSITLGADSRLKLRDSLLSVKNYPGVTGKTSLLESGDSEKYIFALTVKKKKIIEEN